GFGVTDCDGGILVQEKHRDWLADNIAAANDDCMLAADGEVAALENFDDACRRAGGESGAAGLEFAGIHGMESIHIFGWRDGVEEKLGVDLLGKRELNQDAVDVVSIVEGID